MEIAGLNSRAEAAQPDPKRAGLWQERPVHASYLAELREINESS
jgi:hypothetical protein